MNIIMFLLLGIVAGWLASIIMKTNQSQGILGDMVMGVLGALIGGSVMDLIGAGETVSGFNVYSVLVATLGAVLLIWIRRQVRI